MIHPERLHFCIRKIRKKYPRKLLKHANYQVGFIKKVQCTLYCAKEALYTRIC